nr:single-stranded-DNA-specific exonuclease RecJ [Maliibacterium massiliense]
MLRFLPNTDAPDAGAIKVLAGALEISPFLAEVLLQRGVDTPEKAQRYFHPDLTMLHDPFLLRDMDKAVARISRAIEKKERVVVYGDYDADGVTATTLMMGYLERQGVPVYGFLPMRQEEGYGLHLTTIDQIAEKIAPALIITVDCGITAVEEAAHASALGIDMIVTDHHECPAVLPDVVACVNPKRADQKYPFTGLAGVGVAAKVLQALGGTDALLPYWDVLATGTIADIVPLMDENRVFASIGLDKLRAQPCTGLRALMAAAGCRQEKVSAGDVGFMLAPRINAGGRMDTAMDALELMRAEDEARAAELATYLNDLNVRRQQVERGITEQAIARIEAGEVDLRDGRVIVLEDPNWDDGVVGIVASRLAERYNRPTLLLCGRGEVAKGSGRSIAGVDLYGALQPASDLLERFGGHQMAAGVTVKLANIPALVARLNEALASYPQELFLPTVHYDVRVDMRALDYGFINMLQALEPTGFGNAAPLFLLEHVTPTAVNAMGVSGAHLRLLARQQDAEMQAIAFGWGARAREIAGMGQMDMVVRVGLNTYQGRTTPQLQMRAVAPCCDVETYLQRISAEKQDFFRAIYPHIYYNECIPPVTMAWEEALLAIQEALEERFSGTLVLATSRGMACALAEALGAQIAARRIDVAFGAMPCDGRAFNTLVIAPDALDADVLSRYAHIYVLGAPVVAQTETFLVPDAQAIGQALDALAPLEPTHDCMTRAYRALRQAQGRLPAMRGAQKVLLDWSLQVFEQLGFIGRRNNGAIVFLPQREKRLLTASPAYNQGRARFAQWADMLQQLLQA